MEPKSIAADRKKFLRSAQAETYISLAIISMYF